VLIPLFRDAQGERRIAIIRRAEGGRHGGQLAFPGGAREREDASMLDTALREAREEVGIDPRTVEILEHLPVLDTHTTGFRIHPFLARVVRPEHWTLALDEVIEVLEPRIRDLMSPDAHGEAEWQMPAWPRPHLIAFYRIGSHRLWGASYRILHPLLPRIAAGGW